MIYSPSRTKEWLACPTKLQLRQLGYVPRMVQKRDWTALMSQGIHAAAAWHWNKQPDAAEAAEAIWAAGIAQWRAAGRVWTHPDEDAYHAFMGHGIRHLTSQDTSLPIGCHVTATEYELTDYGPCRIDVLWRCPHGLGFDDLKVIYDCKEDWRQSRLDSYEYDWQMLHYAWALQQQTKETVDSFGITALFLRPTMELRRQTFKVNQAALQRWAASATYYWDQILVGEYALSVVKLPMNTTSCNDFGGCPNKKACFLYNLDEQLMAADYVKLPQGGDDASERRD